MGCTSTPSPSRRMVLGWGTWGTRAQPEHVPVPRRRSACSLRPRRHNSLPGRRSALPRPDKVPRSQWGWAPVWVWPWLGHRVKAGASAPCHGHTWLCQAGQGGSGAPLGADVLQGPRFGWEGRKGPGEECGGHGSCLHPARSSPSPQGSEFLHGAECSCSPKPQNLGVLSREMSMGFSALRAGSAPLVGAAMGSALPKGAQAVGMVQGWLLSPCCSPPSSPAQPCGEASADVQVLNYR